MISAGHNIKTTGNLLVSLADHDKEDMLLAVKRMYEVGYKILATAGTHWFLSAHKIKSTKVNKVREGKPHVLQFIEEGKVDLMFNTTLGPLSVHDSHLFRKKALAKGVYYITSVFAANALSLALLKQNEQGLWEINSLQDLHPSQIDVGPA